MTANDLKQLKALKTEVEYLANEIMNMCTEYVTDSVKDYRSGYPHTITIRGVSTYKADKMRRKLEKKQEQLQKKIYELESFLDTVPDSEMRQILRLKYRNGLTDAEIGQILGFERSTISYRISKFFNKK